MLSAISACDNTTNGEQPLLGFLRKAGPPIYPNAQDQSSSDAEQEKLNFLFLNNMISDPQQGASKRKGMNNDKWPCVL